MENGDQQYEHDPKPNTCLSSAIKESCSRERESCSKEVFSKLKHGDEFLTAIILVSLFLFVVRLVLEENEFDSDSIQTFLSISYLWLASIFGGYILHLFRLPSNLGMLAAGIILTNASDKIEIPEHLSATVTHAGLAIVLLRSGLELDIKCVQKSSWLTFRLTVIPGFAEAIVSGLLAMLLFDMPFWLGMSLGFILAAVSPALVVAGMLKLSKLGYGVSKGIPSLIVACASFDDVVAICFFSLCIGMAIQDKSTGFAGAALLGPLSVVLGIFIGLLLASLGALTKLWNTTWKRTALVTLLALSVMFGMQALSYPGGGAMGSITLGVASSFYWQNGYPNRFAVIADSHFADKAEQQISILWSLAFEPLLFGSIGSSLHFDLIPNGTVLKSLCLVSIGSICRLLSAFSVTARSNLTTKERGFIALAWMPKATVQAALCSFPLLQAKEVFSKDDPLFEHYMLWGSQILSTAILSICVTAPLGVISIQSLGQLWLDRQDKDAGRHIEPEIHKHETIHKNIQSDHLRLGDQINKIDDLIEKMNANISTAKSVACSILIEAKDILYESKPLLLKNDSLSLEDSI